jgi:predicted kinase
MDEEHPQHRDEPHKHDETQRPRLFVMCGLPFAGKSTLAAALGRSLHVRIIRMDAINTARGVGLNGAPISPEQWEETYAKTYRQLAGALAAGMSLIYDAANFTKRERDEVRSIASRSATPVTVIYVPILPHEARVRLLANRAEGVRHDVRDEDFALVLRCFEPPDAEPDVVVYDPTIPLKTWIRRAFPGWMPER